MEKQCKSCGTMAPMDDRFCQVCGSSDFIMPNLPVNEDMFESTTVLNDNFENTTVLNDNFAQQQNNEQQANPDFQQMFGSLWQQSANQGSQQPNGQNWQQPTGQNWQQPEQNWQQPAGQNWQQPVQPPPKKKNTGLVIGIIAGVVILLAIIGSIAEKALQSADYGNDSNLDYDYSYNDNSDDAYGFDSYSSEDTSSYVEEKIEYTKGGFDGSVYVNDWADIKLNLPQGFSNADAATYAAGENDSTDCGAYFVADDTLSAIYICYEKLPIFPSYSESEYLDAVMNSLEGVTEITYQTTSTYSSINIGGYTYTKGATTFVNNYGTFCHNFYVRKIDNYAVVISVMAVSDSAADALANQVTRVN
ncbi:MAG: hypothetical protein IIX54_05720 [Clostridia bacterium]|nr:hypothetical protein [Clostridia bacterium]